MKQIEFVKIAAAINTAFKDTIKTKEQMTLWYDNLMDLDYMVCQKAVKKIIQESEFSPKIATIRKEYYNVLEGSKLTSTDSIGLINAAIQRFGHYRAAEAMKWIKEQDNNTYKVVKAIGFSNYCKADPNFTRNITVKMYDEVAKETEKSKMLNRTFASEIRKIQTNGFKLLEGTQ
jgi:hypothetical protein